MNCILATSEAVLLMRGISNSPLTFDCSVTFLSCSVVHGSCSYIVATSEAYSLMSVVINSVDKSSSPRLGHIYA